MTVRRITRVNELLRREIGTALFRVVNDRGFDLSSVTITHVFTSNDLRKAHVLVSVLGHEGQREKMLDALRGHRAEIQDIIHRNIVVKYTPRLTFSLDTSLEQGDKVLDILRGLEGPENGDYAEVPQEADPAHAGE